MLCKLHRTFGVQSRLQFPPGDPCSPSSPVERAVKAATLQSPSKYCREFLVLAFRTHRTRVTFVSRVCLVQADVEAAEEWVYQQCSSGEDFSSSRMT